MAVVRRAVTAGVAAGAAVAGYTLLPNPTCQSLRHRRQSESWPPSKGKMCARTTSRHIQPAGKSLRQSAKVVLEEEVEDAVGAEGGRSPYYCCFQQSAMGSRRVQGTTVAIQEQSTRLGSKTMALRYAVSHT